jgi:hypothetical protein
MKFMDVGDRSNREGKNERIHPHVCFVHKGAVSRGNDRLNGRPSATEQKDCSINKKQYLSGRENRSPPRI